MLFSIISSSLLLTVVLFRFMLGDFDLNMIFDIIDMMKFNICVLSFCFIVNINSYFMKFLGKISLVLYLVYVIVLS